MATVIGIFASRDQAEKAVQAMREKGITDQEISIVAKKEKIGGERTGGGRDDEEGGMNMMAGDLSTGMATGGALGGLAGVLAGAGALAIPGLGPIVAAGPIVAGLTGAAAGGLTGSLIDMGIPQERGQYYEEKVKEGKILAVVKADDKKVSEAAMILRQNGATDVETH